MRNGGRGGGHGCRHQRRGLKRRLGRSYSSGNGQRQHGSAWRRVERSSALRATASSSCWSAGEWTNRRNWNSGQSHLAPCSSPNENTCLSSSSSSLSASAEQQSYRRPPARPPHRLQRPRRPPLLLPRRTWERVLAAEVLRRCLSGYEASSRISLAAASSSSPLPPRHHLRSAASASAVAVVDWISPRTSSEAPGPLPAPSSPPQELIMETAAAATTTTETKAKTTKARHC